MQCQIRSCRVEVGPKLNKACSTFIRHTTLRLTRDISLDTFEAKISPKINNQPILFLFCRALKFTKDNFNATISKMDFTPGDEEILVQINRFLKQYVDLLENCREREAITQIFNISRIGNQLMQAEKPWKLVKSTDVKEKSRAASVVSFCANITCLLGVLVEPYMPALSKNMLEQLNVNLEDVNILAQDKDSERLFR